MGTDVRQMTFAARFGFCAALMGLSVVAPCPVLAVPLVTVVETATGQFTLFNNSNNWVIYGFEIERPALTSNPTTTQPGWSAYTCTFTCNVAASAGFGYTSSGNPFATGIAPHTSSNRFFFADPVPKIPDGTSNTILLTEPLSIFVFATAQIRSIPDGTSNTIVFGEIGQPSFPVRIGFRGSVLPGIADGTSNTIFVGEALITPVPAALPLFATGLGALGLMALRRKRKQPAQAIRQAV
jgi:hypothetical protein